MPQVSRKPLSKRTEEELFKIFFKSFARLSDPSDIQKFFFALLSPVEQTMLAKRLAIALLLSKGWSYESIKQTLNVSQETIARVNMSFNYKGEGYQMVIKKMLRDEKLENIFNNIEDATIAIFPSSSLKGSLMHDRRKRRKPKTLLG